MDQVQSVKISDGYELTKDFYANKLQVCMTIAFIIFLIVLGVMNYYFLKPKNEGFLPMAYTGMPITTPGIPQIDMPEVVN